MKNDPLMFKVFQKSFTGNIFARIRCFFADGNRGKNTYQVEPYQLFDEAEKCIKLAEYIEIRSYTDALRIYKEALIRIKQIVSEYPMSELAIKIEKNEQKLGPFTFVQIKSLNELKTHRLRVQSYAEENGLICALLIDGTDSDTIAQIVRHYAQNKNYDKALHWARNIENMWMMSHIKYMDEIKALTYIAEEYIKDEKISIALQILNDAFQIANTKFSEEWSYCRKKSLNAIASSFAKANEYKKAIKIASFIENDDIEKAVAIRDIVVEYAKKGHYNDALELSMTIDGYFRDTAFAEISMKYAQEGNYDLALSLAERIKEARPKCLALATISLTQSRKENAEKYSELFPKSLNIIEAIEDEFVRISIFVEIASKCIEFSETEKALKLLSLAVQTAKTLKDSKSRSLSLCLIAGEYSKINQENIVSELLIQSLHEIEAEKKYNVRDILSCIATRYAECEQYENSFDVIKMIDDEEKKEHEFAMLAIKFEEKKQISNAVKRKILHRIIRETEEFKECIFLDEMINERED